MCAAASHLAAAALRRSSPRRSSSRRFACCLPPSQAIIRLFKYMRFNKRLTMITRVLQSALKDIVAFFIVRGRFSPLPPS